MKRYRISTAVLGAAALCLLGTAPAAVAAPARHGHRAGPEVTVQMCSLYWSGCTHEVDNGNTGTFDVTTNTSYFGVFTTSADPDVPGYYYYKDADNGKCFTYNGNTGLVNSDTCGQYPAAQAWKQISDLLENYQAAVGGEPYLYVIPSNLDLTTAPNAGLANEQWAF
jgi:hypothetical protein